MFGAVVVVAGFLGGSQSLLASPCGDHSSGVGCAAHGHCALLCRIVTGTAVGGWILDKWVAKQLIALREANPGVRPLYAPTRRVARVRAAQCDACDGGVVRA